MSNEVISLSHGSGGKATNKLINNLFYKYFDNDILNQKNGHSTTIIVNCPHQLSTINYLLIL